MSIKFICVKCGHRLKAYPDQAGKTCKCTRCGHSMPIPGPPALPGAAIGRAMPGRGRPFLGKKLLIIMGLAAFLLVGVDTLTVALMNRGDQIDQNVSDLTGNVPEARAQALLALAQADPQDAHRAQVTAALEPLVVEGDPRRTLDPQLLLQTYLHWAGKDNVPSLIRIVENPHLPSWSVGKTELVMQKLGKVQDNRAADVLARKLTDPQLHNQAVDALKLLGSGAANAVLDYVFVDDPATQQRASDLLADYGIGPDKLIAAARSRLESNDPEMQRLAAAWFAVNPPDSHAEKKEVAQDLARLLGDLSPRTNGPALRGLKLWATKDCLPQVVNFAQRLEKARDSKEVAANKSAVIDVLAKFPDQIAAEAIALELKDPTQRARAVQALLKLGPVASGTVLEYLNHPDEGVRKEAESMARMLKIPDDRQLRQTLADVADARKARSRAALRHLARLRSDDTSRPVVSKALNAPLLDKDVGIRDDALDALRVWATPENTAALLKLFGSLHGDRAKDDKLTGDKVARILISIGPSVEDSVIPLLKSSDALVRRQACWILTEIGTAKSVPPLQAAGMAYGPLDPPFYNQTQDAIAKVMARK